MEGPVSFVSIQLELCVGEKEAWVGEGHLTGGSKGFEVEVFLRLLMLSDDSVTVILAGADPSIW